MDSRAGSYALRQLAIGMEREGVFRQNVGNSPTTAFQIGKSFSLPAAENAVSEPIKLFVLFSRIPNFIPPESFEFMCYQIFDFLNSTTRFPAAPFILSHIMINLSYLFRFQYFSFQVFSLYLHIHLNLTSLYC